MSTTLAIAKNTLKEAIRDKILYTVSFLGVLYIIFVFFLATVSLDQGKRVVIDFGLVGILFFGIAISIFVGANLLYKEIIGGTALIIFPKPLTKGQYIIGKFLGLAGTILIITLLLTVIFVVGYLLQNKTLPNLIVFGAIIFSLLEILIIVAISILFGSFTHPISSSLYSLAIFLIGHSFSMIVNSAIRNGNKITIAVSKMIYYLLPNLEKFNLRQFAVYDIPVTPTEIISGSLYAIIYISLALFIATAAIKKREF